MNKKHYVFDNTTLQSEAERLRLIEHTFDPGTRTALEKIGLREGSICLEIGPGTGSIMEWMCERAGHTGQVTAIDLNTRFIQSIQRDNLKIHQADISTFPLEDNKFDVIHARYVLIHIQQTSSLIPRLVHSLRPGGQLLIEDPDFTSAQTVTDQPEKAVSFLRIREAICQMYTAKGLDPSLGRKLKNTFIESGLTDVQETVVEEKIKGGHPMALMMKQSAMALKDQYIQTQAATLEDIQHYCELAESPQAMSLFYAHVTVMGKKPLRSE